jgi:aspartate/methionine/tyrosine aminotransferase
MSACVAATVARLAAQDALQLELPPPTAQGDDLSGDHPAFAPVPEARAAVRDALTRGETHYADVPGVAPLREALGAALAAWGLPVDSAEGLMVTAGEQEARFLATQTLASAGYRLVLPSVVHPGARKAAALGQVVVDRLPLDSTTLCPDIESLRAAFAGGPAALYLESPNRLSGQVLDRGLVEAIAAEVVRADALVIWDASLAGWVETPEAYVPIGALPGMADRTVTIGSMWSGTGLEGWLAAYLAGPPRFFARARSLKQIIAICTATPAQWGVLGALRAVTPSDQRARREVLRQYRDEAVSLWPEVVLPGTTVSLVAVRVPNGLDAHALGVRAMPGAPFGAPDLLRLTVTAEGAVVGVMRALARAARTGGRR